MSVRSIVNTPLGSLDFGECKLCCKKTGNTKGGSITVLLTSRLTGLYWSVLQI